jgi:hypothetical protein
MSRWGFARGCLVVAAWSALGIGSTAAALRAQEPEEPSYRRDTVRQVTGVVERVGLHTGRRGTPRSRVTVRTPEGVVEVHLGPTSFLSEKGMTPALRETIEVVGSLVTQGDGQLVIAREIRTRGRLLLLRDEAGRPLWEERHK